MKKLILIFFLSVLTSFAADKITETNTPLINVSGNTNSADKDKNATEQAAPAENIVELEMEPEEDYIFESQQSTTKTVEVFNASGRGLLRGGANIVTCPAELIRGFTYEYTARKWYVAAGTSFLAALGGTGARLSAGVGDIITLGTFGDVDLVEGFPDYVWQGAWVYKPKRAVPTKSTSNPSVAAASPDRDIIAGVSPRVIKAREQENVDFYESKLPREAY